MSRVGEQALLRGIALTQLFEPGAGLFVQRRVDLHEALFTVQDAALVSVVLVKISTAPKRWQFTFTAAELGAIQSDALEIKPQHRFALLVCKTDGVCCLSIGELMSLLEGSAEGSRAIGVSRPRGGSYHLSGPGRIPLGYTIPANDWPLKVLRGAK